MESLNGVIKFLSSDNMSGLVPSTGDVGILIMILIAFIAMGFIIFTKLVNNKNHLNGKHVSGGIVTSNTKVIQICSVVLLAVSLMVIAFTGVKAFASEVFSIDNFEVTADLQNNTVSYSQSNLVNNGDDDMKIQSMALTKESSVDDNDAVWTIKYGDKILYSGQATGKDVPVEDIVVSAKQTASLTLTAENLSAQKVSDLAKSSAVISFSFKLDKTEVDYTVNHWKLDSDGKRPESPTGSETLKGKAGELTKAQEKTYDGYTAKTFEQQTIKGDGTTVVDIDYEVNKPTLKSLDFDDVHYYPVVTQFKGAKFYNDEQEEIKPASTTTGYEMSDLTNAHFYSGDTSFKAVRSINEVSYNAVYGTDTTAGAKEVDTDWANYNLKTGESVEKLTNQSSPSGEPKIENIGLTTIWKAFNSMQSSDGFGGYLGRFWSCVADDEYVAWCWYADLGESGKWDRYDLNYAYAMCVCVSRAFN